MLIQEQQKLNERLLQACKNDDLKLVKYLLKKGANANVIDGDQWTLLLSTMNKTRNDIVLLLLERQDINVNATGILRWTPLYHASHKGYQDIIKSLLKREDVEVNATDDNKNTPLLAAISSMNGKDIVPLLLEHKNIEVNARNNSGWSPLHYASYKGYQDIAKLLLKRGANPYIKNYLDKNAIDYIKENSKFTEKDKKELLELIDDIYKPYTQGAVNGMAQLSNKINPTDSIFPISQLPKDILNVIAGFIDPYTAGRITRVCREAYIQANGGDSAREKLDKIRSQSQSQAMNIE